VNGTLVFSLAVGLSVRDVSENAIANLEYEKILHPRLLLRRLEPLLEQVVAGLTGGNAREFLARALLPAACALLTE
jgi:hypothetical protein